jgi:hypothetical protein
MTHVDNELGHVDVDDELRRALRRVEPPPGFAERVLQRADERGPDREGDAIRHMSGGAMIRWATAAALAVAVTGGVWHLAEQRRQAQGEDARRQVLIGLRIASSKLQFVQLKVNQRGAP